MVRTEHSIVEQVYEAKGDPAAADARNFRAFEPFFEN